MNGTRYIFLVAKRRVSVYATLCLPFCLQFQFSLLSTYHDRLSKRLRVLRVLIVKFMGTKRKILVALPCQVINSIEYTFKVTSRKWRKNVNKYLWIIRRALYEEFYIYTYIYIVSTNGKVFLGEFLRFAGILILSACFGAEILWERKYLTRTKQPSIL